MSLFLKPFVKLGREEEAALRSCLEAHKSVVSFSDRSIRYIVKVDPRCFVSRHPACAGLAVLVLYAFKPRLLNQGQLLCGSVDQFVAEQHVRVTGQNQSTAVITLESAVNRKLVEYFRTEFPLELEVG